MGYRSDVCIFVMHPDAKKEFAVRAEKNKYFQEMLLSEYPNGSKVTIRDDFVLLQWTAVKWYDDYLDVQAFTEFYNHFANIIDVNSTTEGCAKVIIGEDCEIDFDAVGCGGDYVYPIQSIAIDI